MSSGEEHEKWRAWEPTQPWEPDTLSDSRAALRPAAVSGLQREQLLGKQASVEVLQTRYGGGRKGRYGIE